MADHDPDLTCEAKQAIREYIKELDQDLLIRDKQLTPAAEKKIRQYVLLILGVPTVVCAIILSIIAYFTREQAYQNAAIDVAKPFTSKLVELIASTTKANVSAEASALSAKGAAAKAAQAQLRNR